MRLSYENGYISRFKDNTSKFFIKQTGKNVIF